MLKLEETWLIICEGPSLKLHVKEVKRIADILKERTIGVNYAPLVFPCKYWCFMDVSHWKKIGDYYDPSYIYITPTLKAECKKFDGKKVNIEFARNQNGCSGNAAIDYAIKKGARHIITVGQDLTDDWEHYNGRKAKSQNKGFIDLCKNSLTEMIKHSNATIYSLDKDNTLGLKFIEVKDIK